MDEVDTPVKTDDGVVNNNDDDASTVEETYEITHTRRKTIRTSYKIQEVSPLINYNLYAQNVQHYCNYEDSIGAIPWMLCTDE